MDVIKRYILREINRAKEEGAKKLSLAGLYLSEIPEEVFEFEELEELDIRRNHIKIIDENIFKLKNLKVLDIRNMSPEYLVDFPGLILDDDIYRKSAKKISPTHILGLKVILKGEKYLSKF